MNVLIFGASGLIGQGVLLQTLDHPAVDSVVSVGRRTLGLSHPKLRERVHEDFIKSTRDLSSRGAFTRAIYAGLYPMLRALGAATTNTAIGDAMLSVATVGSDREVLDSREINRLSELSGDRKAG